MFQNIPKTELYTKSKPIDKLSLFRYSLNDKRNAEGFFGGQKASNQLRCQLIKFTNTAANPNSRLIYVGAGTSARITRWS